MEGREKEIFDKFTLLKVIEQEDEDLAVEIVSNPLIDQNELSDLLNTSMMGLIKNKDSGEPLKLGQRVEAAAWKNKILRSIEKLENE